MYSNMTCCCSVGSIFMKLKFDTFFDFFRTHRLSIRHINMNLSKKAISELFLKTATLFTAGKNSAKELSGTAKWEASLIKIQLKSYKTKSTAERCFFISYLILQTVSCLCRALHLFVCRTIWFLWQTKAIRHILWRR